MERGKHIPLFQKMDRAVERRMCVAAEEILRESWPAYAAASAIERAAEWEQILKDAVTMPMMNQAGLIADYLDTIAETDHGMQTPRAISRDIANRLIARRRDIELEELEALDLSPAFPAPPGRSWSLVTRVAVAVLAIFFALLAIVVAIFLPTGTPMAERIFAPLVLLGIDVVLVGLFFSRRAQARPAYEGLKEMIREDILRRYTGAKG